MRGRGGGREKEREKEEREERERGDIALSSQKVTMIRWSQEGYLLLTNWPTLKAEEEEDEEEEEEACRTGL